MSPEAQRIAIAEACGLRNINTWKDMLWADSDTAFLESWATSGHWHGEVPKYLTDLNAMHEAEKVLTTQDEIDGFTSILLRVLWRPDWKGVELPSLGWWKITTYEMMKIHRATAAQRAEAFLRTLGRWRDAT